MSQDIFVYCALAPSVTGVQTVLTTLRMTVELQLEAAEDLCALSGMLPFSLGRGRLIQHSGVDWHCRPMSNAEQQELESAFAASKDAKRTHE